MKTILLTQGKVALVDDEDFERLSVFKWYAHKHRNTFYARRNITCGVGKQKTVRMHQEILSSSRIDHKDGNGLNNQKANLRAASAAQNNFNRGKHAEASSQFKGVSWHKQCGKWCAYLNAFGIRKYLGLFASEIDAARAYDSAAKSAFGEFARLNL